MTLNSRAMPHVRCPAISLALAAAWCVACGESERVIGTVEIPGTAVHDDGGSNEAAPADANAPADADAGGSGLLAALPLHTQSRFVVDAQGNRFRFSSVVWYGAESPDLVPYGLDHNTAGDIAKLIHQLGFNSVRLPWCNQMVESNPVVPDALLSSNPNLIGQTALEVFDAVIDALAAEGVLIILDNHRSKGEWCCDVAHGDGLWHTPEYPETSWIADWENLARRYRSQRLVVGADVRDAPRSQLAANAPATCTDCSDTCPCDVATWGGADPATDWASAAERAGNALHAINSDLLIIVEGIDSSRTVPAALRPITLNIPNRVVYSPHDYPYTYNGVMTFASYADFKTTLDQEWGYLLNEGQPYTGPVWTVFGASHDGTDATFWGYMRQYITEKDVEWAYWAVNGTEGHGYTRDFGAEESYGVLDVNWSGMSNATHVSAIQALPR
jgi:endoglucanase